MRSKSLTIFEGPDGAGKSTAAQRYAELTGARYVHFPALPHVGKNLGRMYVEAMVPALLGYQDVVFDRCWLSELPYGIAFRNGVDRLGHASRRMLERLAMRCGAVVVHCDPGWETVRRNYLGRRESELLENEAQLNDVFSIYQITQTHLPWLTYDYQTRDVNANLVAELDSLRMCHHPLGANTAGNLEAKVAIVGDVFAERKDCDAWYQWPFASFSGAGCSQWLTEALQEWGIGEHKLLWLNSDMDLELLTQRPYKIVALGEKAVAELYRHKLSGSAVEHPQYWKRFKKNEPYPLTLWLKEIV